MIPKSMPSGFDPMGGYRFSEKIMRDKSAKAYLILDSRNSTCFLATGSYFFLILVALAMVSPQFADWATT
jgi:hypothetical protein